MDIISVSAINRIKKWFKKSHAGVGMASVMGTMPMKVPAGEDVVIPAGRCVVMDQISVEEGASLSVEEGAKLVLIG